MTRAATGARLPEREARRLLPGHGSRPPLTVGRMLTSEQAASVLMRWSPYSAPITWQQLARAIGAASPRAAKRHATRLHMGRHGWASAGIYAHQRAALHPEWPEPLPLVRASLEELLARRRSRKPAAPTGPL